MKRTPPDLSNPVHPRIRGERDFFIIVKDLLNRFIPAYAGNARRVSRLVSLRAVHPRIRGERQNGTADSQRIGGSSPHTRGTHDQERPGQDQSRFIPAYAGNAASGPSSRVVIAVHPRIRGERAPLHADQRRRHGSSPHTRGTRESVNLHNVPGRFIPAYAGNARGVLVQVQAGPVHPRIRGERTDGCVNLLPADGSSPHTRGTPIFG